MGLPREYTVVSGGAIGVDRTAENAARTRRMKVISIRPDYRRFTWWAAPKERNTEIVAACDKLVAFWHDGSGGTEDVIEKARNANKLMNIYYSDGRIE
jgi:hypothetical protein